MAFDTSIGANAPPISSFQNSYPKINIELGFSSRPVDLISGKFDFVFRMGELVDSSLIAIKLTDIQMEIYASPTYLSNNGAPNAPKELSNHRCIAGSIKTWAFINIKTTEKQQRVNSMIRYQCDK